MSVRSYRHCRFEVDDKIHPDCDDGLVVINGPRASIYVWSKAKGRFEQIDRLIEVEEKAVGDGSVIVRGQSTHLIDTVRVPTKGEAQIVMHVTPRKRCKDCG